MPIKPTRPIAQDAYDQLADAYAERVDTKSYNAYYERPATLSLLPDVSGKHVLDAGCGPGVYSEWLVSHGAQVIAIDGNARMVELAKMRLGSAVQVLQASLEDPLEFLQDASFDLVLAPLVMDYIRKWQPTFMEFHRVLKPGGCFIFSMEHPLDKFIDFSQTSIYYNVERVEYTWCGFGKAVKVPTHRRPMGEVINPLIQAGFTLDYLLEPLPTPEFAAAEPVDYQKLQRMPGFMCIRALKK